MDKLKEIIVKLYDSQPGSGVMEIICDIVCAHNAIKKSESLLVITDEYGYECIDDQVIEERHHWIFESIDEFCHKVLTSAPKGETRHFGIGKVYVDKFLEIREFVSDFANNKEGKQ